jgi:hypothetical protein
VLYVHFGLPEYPLDDPDALFDSFYEADWILDALPQQMILDVDKSRVLGNHAIESPVLDIIPPTWLSGGVKGLIMLHKMEEDSKINHLSTSYGDNCSKWILEISSNKDINIWYRHLLDMPKDMTTPVTFVDFGNAVATNYAEYLKLLLRDAGRLMHGNAASQ